MKFQKLEKREIVFVATIGSVFALLLVVLLVMSINRLSVQKNTVINDSNDGMGMLADDDYNLFINNYYQLTQTYGTSGASAIRKQLISIVFSDSELAAATKEAESSDGNAGHYVSTLIESSFRAYDRSVNSYAFTLEISDGRTYDVYVRPCFDDAVDMCYGVAAIRDGVMNFESKAVSDYAIEELEDWKNNL